jgi:diguanylate cyclase (GGDEF)-like protein
VVDDDSAINDFVTRVLQESGMTAQALREPLRVIDTINEFRPDLILVDLHMPQCTGQELAKVIRQQPDYVGIPIVFLSAETDLTTQLGALSLGGDDFLTKPMLPQHLIQAVSARVRRSRELRSLMTRDSLTGLLNHTAIKERLEQEVTRARRGNSTLSLAMLDIDFFKKINDVHGHPIGDRVIKSLTRLLQQRLRQSDLIGRYGGEEFAVLLPGANADEAKRVLDTMREGFARLRHGTPGYEFSATFSAGIATLPPYETASSLTDNADRALYEAKHNGRNRVKVWEDEES